MSQTLQAAVRGAIGAMAMTGVRVFAVNAGLIREDPPSRLVRGRQRGLLRLVPRTRRRTVIELVHWALGAAFGGLFGMLPERVRLRTWAGPAYGLLVWLGFEAVLAPMLGLRQARWPDARERAVFAVDHMLFGLVLAERRPPG